MEKITLDEFCNQWVKGEWTSWKKSQLDSNIFNFVTLAGKYSQQEFVSSFANGRFCGGTPWAPRTSRWGKRFDHPILIDTGVLSKSIKGEASRNDFDGRRNDRTKVSLHSARYVIRTTESSRAIPGKRGKSSNRYNNYAAVHNTDPKFGLYTVNQYSDRAPVHRQFIGIHPKIDDYINSNYLDMIFEGFPR